MLPSDPGQMATVLVAFAATEDRPSRMSAGNVTSVPPPATELMAPAIKAAPNATAMCEKFKAGIGLVVGVYGDAASFFSGSIDHFTTGVLQQAGILDHFRERSSPVFAGRSL